jgi:8-oxo-dGTP pyrophosphatase MutT (NUDIX family)
MLTTCGIFLFSKTTQKLLACHATHSRWTQWSIPKGLPMEEEEPLPAAIRELEEETGIALGTVADATVFPLPPVHYKKQNKMLRSFLVITHETFETIDFKSTLVDGRDFREVDSWRWMTLEQAAQNLHETQSSLLDAIRELIKTIDKPDVRA